MIRCIALWSLLAALSAPALAQEPSERPPALLWKANKPGGKTLYLVGTLGSGVDLMKVPPITFGLINACQTVVLEVDTRDRAAINATWDKHEKLPEGTSLETVMGAEPYKKVLAHFSKAKPEEIAKLRPFFVGIRVRGAWRAMGPGTDLEVRNRAIRLGKDLVFLETFDHQLEAIAALGDELWSKQLVDLLDALPKEKADAEKLRAAYHAGDVAVLETVLHDPADIAKYPTVHEKLVQERNAAWIPKLEAELAKGDVYAALGVEHLVGKGSVLERLGQAGYTVERMAR